MCDSELLSVLGDYAIPQASHRYDSQVFAPSPAGPIPNGGFPPGNPLQGQSQPIRRTQPHQQLTDQHDGPVAVHLCLTFRLFSVWFRRKDPPHIIQLLSRESSSVQVRLKHHQLINFQVALLVDSQESKKHAIIVCTSIIFLHTSTVPTPTWELRFYFIVTVHPSYCCHVLRKSLLRSGCRP